ncbi:triose-phosphate isomerase [Halomonas sp. KM-1]|uniref:triose-phosphate isomerase n=1 Tax=Halomonas sp. KM-1 TaxID=590061 RepID=UPI0002892708|nr:triose-phosphate isomerase [Halomonas sp. KM-1]
MGIRTLVAGNWKMHGLINSLRELKEIEQNYPRESTEKIDSLICLPATLISSASLIVASGFLNIGGQDCSVHEQGPYTGDISATMLKDAGANYVIVGHSERRIGYHETNSLVRKKAEAALNANLKIIICIGETLSDNKLNKTYKVLEEQINESVPDLSNSSNTVIAYEPVWSIGSGLIPSEEEIGLIHEFIRSKLKTKLGGDANFMRIIYGGSVNPDNIKGILGITNVNGVLVGRAAMKAKDFIALLNRPCSI